MNLTRTKGNSKEQRAITLDSLAEVLYKAKGAPRNGNPLDRGVALGSYLRPYNLSAGNFAMNVVVNTDNYHLLGEKISGRYPGREQSLQNAVKEVFDRVCKDLRYEEIKAAGVARDKEELFQSLAKLNLEPIYSEALEAVKEVKQATQTLVEEVTGAVIGRELKLGEWVDGLDLQGHDIHEIIKERTATHGSFEENSKISEGLSSYITKDMPIIPSAALRAVFIKASRVIAGDPWFEDHWKDIKGYAELVLLEILEAKEAAKAEKPKRIVKKSTSKIKKRRVA